MCGICGFITKRKIPIDLLKKMNDTMIHRGPDDAGAEIFHADSQYENRSKYYVGMAHRRLSIIDLSVNGHQPMWSTDGRKVIVFNGEIYNYKKLKQELSDYRYKSDSDTEVILAAYQKWGDDFVKKIQGMFGLALYDLNRHKLILARDHIGKKPLYYWDNGDEIYFASELKPIMELPWFNKKINKRVMARYLTQLYINAPETIFTDVYKVEPGSTVTINVEADKIYKVKEKFWDVNDSYKSASHNPVISFADAKSRLKELLRESVKKRLESDVPIGCLLSGGVDSSIVSAVAQELPV